MMTNQDALKAWASIEKEERVVKVLLHYPIINLMRKMGLNVAPLVFWSPPLAALFLALTMPIFFIPFFVLGIVMGNIEESTSFFCLLILFSFGVSMVMFFYLVYTRRRLRITTWSSFKESNHSA